MIQPINKLPRVTGRGSLAWGFRVAFEAINQIIDRLQSVEVKPSPSVRVNRTPAGTTLTAEGGGETVTSGGTYVARWQ